MSTSRADRLKARFAETPPGPPEAAPAEAETPAVVRVRKTFYLRRDLAERLDAEQRRLNFELGGLPKSRLLEALLEFGFAHLDAEVLEALRGDEK